MTTLNQNLHKRIMQAVCHYGNMHYLDSRLSINSLHDISLEIKSLMAQYHISDLPDHHPV